MKSFDTELQKHAKKIRMRITERRELRERILTYIEYHPLPKQSKIGKHTDAIASERFVTFSFNTIYTRVAAGVFAVVLVIGVPLAAEHSVPGDILYPVKTGLNESIRAQFVGSPYEQVVYETQLIERRIAEARLLAKEGRLTSEVEAEIAETVKIHADAAQKGIAELKNTDADEGAIAEIAFGSALEVQSAVLDSGVNANEASGTSGIALAVREARANADAQKSNVAPSYERLMARVELETTRAFELFESINGSATEEEHANIERRLADIDRSVLKAQELYESGDSDASKTLMLALSLTQKLISFMTDIDVRENVELETIVPVTPTDEEEAERLGTKFNYLVEKWQNVTLRFEVINDETLRTKIEEGRRETNRFEELASTSLAAKEFVKAEDAIKGMEEFVEDIDTLTRPFAATDVILVEDKIQEETGEEEETVVEDESTETEAETLLNETGIVEGTSTEEFPLPLLGE